NAAPVPAGGDAGPPGTAESAADEASEAAAEETAGNAPEAPGEAPNKVQSPAKSEAPAPDPPIIAAWKLRDQLNVSTANRPSPAVVAPHLWNELNATLLALHLEQMDGSDRNSGTIATQIEQLRGGLQNLLDGVPPRHGPGGLVTDRLATSIRSYRASPEFAA